MSRYWIIFLELFARTHIRHIQWEIFGNGNSFRAHILAKYSTFVCTFRICTNNFCRVCTIHVRIYSLSCVCVSNKLQNGNRYTTFFRFAIIYAALASSFSAMCSLCGSSRYVPMVRPAEAVDIFLWAAEAMVVVSTTDRRVESRETTELGLSDNWADNSMGDADRRLVDGWPLLVVNRRVEPIRP